jgi:tetratricopeptide (TPR) repeat protein
MLRSSARITAWTAIAVVGLSAPASGAQPKGSLVAFRDANPLQSETTMKSGLAATQLACQGISLPSLPGSQLVTLPGSVHIPGLPPGVHLPKLPGVNKKKPKIPSFKTALAHALAVAMGGGARKVLAQLRRGPALRTERAAHGFAVASELAGSPRLALAGLLSAESLDPGDRMNLVNAAEPLAMLGKPADAVALLQHAAKMRGPLPAAMGLPGAAVLENNLGYAESKLKDHTAAIAALRKALVAAPAMAEANTSLGSELVCAGRSAEGLKYLRAGLARNKLDYVSISEASGGLNELLPSVPIASEITDLSAGQDGVLPAFAEPSSPTQWLAFHPNVAAMNAAESAESSKVNATRAAALPVAQALPGSLATKYRSSSLEGLVNTSLDEPEIKALHDTALADLKAADKITNDHWAVAVPAKFKECLSQPDAQACFTPWCQQSTASAQGSFNAAYAAADTAMRTYWRVAGHRETGLAANESDQAWNEVAMSDARSHAGVAFGLLLSTLEGWVGPLKSYESSCVEGQEPPPAATDGTPSVPSPGACPPALSSLSGSFKDSIEIPPPAGGGKPSKVDIGLKVSCSKAEIELSQKVAGTGELISLFGKGEQDFKNDTTTIVVGEKGSILGLATGQSGFYVTAGKKGIEDFGWRVGAGGSADPFGGLSKGTVSAKVWGGTENISFVGAIDYIPTAFGLGAH